ncbi:MAG: formate dehydrogenase accessory sulfurtransferase FdhD [Candidatus Omnitrophota bacterium]
MESFRVTKIRAGNKEIIEDPVIEEVPLTLIVADKELATFSCMPADLEDLAAGFLFTSGLIGKKEDIRKIIIDHQRWVARIELSNDSIAKEMILRRVYTSGCGRGALFYGTPDIVKKFKIDSDLKIGAVKISSLVADFQKRSELYLKTGGAHSAALADDEGILIFKEDIGRHNAIDKVIGKRLREGGSFEDMIMISSGRFSSEIILKTQKCAIPILVSISAPTNQAIKLSRNMGITLVGFARGDRMNVYSGEERIGEK